VRYAKVVESAETPAPEAVAPGGWASPRASAPVLVVSAVAGTRDLQEIDGYMLTNEPYDVTVPS